MVTAMYCVLLRARKRANGLTLMLGLNEAFDQLAMANHVHWYGHMLKREDWHAFRRVLEFDNLGKKWRPKRTCKNQVEEESIEVDLSREDTLCLSKWSVGINKIATELVCISLPPVLGSSARFRTFVFL